MPKKTYLGYNFPEMHFGNVSIISTV